MKVRDLLEGDEWDNTSTPETLSYLYKKQASACHQFINELQKLSRLNPDDTSLYHWARINLESAIEWNSHNVTGSLRLGEKYPSLNRLWNRMAKAKEKYEEAGGKYK